MEKERKKYSNANEMKYEKNMKNINSLLVFPIAITTRFHKAEKNKKKIIADKKII